MGQPPGRPLRRSLVLFIRSEVTAEPAFSELELDKEIRFIPEDEFEQLWAAPMAECGGERPYT